MFHSTTDTIPAFHVERGASADAAALRARRFAKIVFTAAGVWGMLIMTPLYFAFDAIGRAYPPPISHADLYYGFVDVTVAWQVAFLIIGANPTRLRPVMAAAILEKALYLASILTLYAHGQLQGAQIAAIVVPDGVLGLLFVAAYVRVSRFVNDGVPYPA